MGKTYIQPGDVVTLTAPTGGVTKDVPVQIGQLLVVPTATVAEGELFEGHTRGVFSVTKAGSQAWAEGAIVYWDAAAGNFTTVATGNFQAGVAVEVVGSGAGETTGKVRLDGIGRVNEAT